MRYLARSHQTCISFITPALAFTGGPPPDLDKRFRIIDRRLPCAALLIWFFALLAPYYGTLNALIGALTSPCIAFIFPALAFTWYFRKPERRKHAHLKPPA